MGRVDKRTLLRDKIVREHPLGLSDFLIPLHPCVVERQRQRQVSQRDIHRGGVLQPHGQFQGIPAVYLAGLILLRDVQAAGQVTVGNLLAACQVGHDRGQILCFYYSPILAGKLGPGAEFSRNPVQVLFKIVGEPVVQLKMAENCAAVVGHITRVALLDGLRIGVIDDQLIIYIHLDIAAHSLDLHLIVPIPHDRPRLGCDRLDQPGIIPALGFHQVDLAGGRIDGCKVTCKGGGCHISTRSLHGQARLLPGGDADTRGNGGVLESRALVDRQGLVAPISAEGLAVFLKI